LAPKFCNSLPPFTPGAVGERHHAVALSPMAGGHMFVIPTEGRNLLFHPSVAVACPSLFARVRISIIPWGLLLLCFHTLTHSFALFKTLSPIFSTSSALFSQNTWGGGVRPSTDTRSHLARDSYNRLAGHQPRITSLYVLLMLRSPAVPAVTQGWEWLRATHRALLTTHYSLLYSNKSGCSRVIRSHSGWNWNHPTMGMPTCECVNFATS
jgi:hypothetical protein